MYRTRYLVYLLKDCNYALYRKNTHKLLETRILCENIKYFSNTTSLNKKDETTSKALVSKSLFDNVRAKNQETFQSMIEVFENRDVHRRGHVEFIYAALRNMEEFGVNRDLATYKKLLDVFPKGKFIATNIFQAELMHYPKQQQCAIDLLEQMENNGVIPDYEMEQTLLNTFGKRGYPLRKFWRMMYWMPKFKNLTPWPLPIPLPDDTLELAKLAIKRIMTVDLQSEIIVQHTSEIKDALDSTWIVTGQSPIQRKLIEEHDATKAIYIEGAHSIWLRNKRVNYFILRAEPKPIISKKDIDEDDVSNLENPFLRTPSQRKLTEETRSVHEQDDGVILAVCATGNSSRDSLLSWIRLLERHGNPKISDIPIVFTLKSPTEPEDLLQITDNERSNNPDSNKIENTSEK